MAPSFLPLAMPRIGAAGGGITRIRITIIVEELSNQEIPTLDFMIPHHHTYWIISVAQDTLLDFLSQFQSFSTKLGLSWRLTLKSFSIRLNAFTNRTPQQISRTGIDRSIPFYTPIHSGMRKSDTTYSSDNTRTRSTGTGIPIGTTDPPCVLNMSP